ncbi:MAG: tRNA pseudouridine(38-40) synthase TruA [Bacteroidales bacterium]|nr:tRNA pseudouridine(38-40) synthase TruA [Bacteroidales bacterium]
MRFFVSLEYNGEKYSGWQRQNNATSIQELLENALSIVSGEEITVTGAGRTDAGVNASCYYAHFDTSFNFKESQNTIYKINAILPYDIVVKAFYKVQDEAHARFDAVSRTYRYYIHTDKDPFASHSLFYKFDIDMEKMNQAALHLMGTQDFTSFEKIGGASNSGICTVTNAQWSELSENHYVFEITANRFLRNMVRSIVGTLLEVGRGKITQDEFKAVIEKHDRGYAGQSVAGEALFLCNIEYPYELY